MKRAPILAVPLVAGDGSVRAFAIIDAADAAIAAPFCWRMDGKGYAIRSVRLAACDWTVQLLHRDLLGLEAGDPREGDHIDGDPLNCRRQNLRILERGQNAQNRRGRGSSPHRGVSWDRATGRWRAYGKSGRRFHHLGYFDDEDVAARVSAGWRATHLPFSVDR